MRRAAPALLLLAVLGLSGCGGEAGSDAAPQTQRSAGTGYSQQVRTNFLTSCVDNARNTANGGASEEQLSATCVCILGKVEQEYSEREFAQFEQRLLGGEASDEESDRLTSWSTDCAQEATS